MLTIFVVVSWCVVKCVSSDEVSSSEVLSSEVSSGEMSSRQACPYTRWSLKHSYCLEKNLGCNIQKSGLTDKEVQQILDKHNEYRNKVATGKEGRAIGGALPQAPNMLQMNERHILKMHKGPWRAMVLQLYSRCTKGLGEQWCFSFTQDAQRGSVGNNASALLKMYKRAKWAKMFQLFSFTQDAQRALAGNNASALLKMHKKVLVGNGASALRKMHKGLWRATVLQLYSRCKKGLGGQWCFSITQDAQRALMGNGSPALLKMYKGAQWAIMLQLYSRCTKGLNGQICFSFTQDAQRALVGNCVSAFTQDAQRGSVGDNASALLKMHKRG
ncbi:hypothetical protein CEXT_550491 [Caerostris extrusa]|uniref:SCP domain-containing protein n=1 Tax=Caerostris extrusa TaxID=172846 RepID=A0AAV4Q4D7_CAEEX|nr:hypothetical protein CEXT_550491 [Caerostris extrusa]